MIELPKSTSKSLVSQVRRLEGDHERLRRSYDQVLDGKGRAEDRFEDLFHAFQAIADGRVDDPVALATGIMEAFNMGGSFEDVIKKYVRRK